MEEPLSNGKNENLCKVCGDKASGKHYGVASCDGCRGFFKRSIRRNLEYVCKENGKCIVDVTRRNQCQACRFKKCLQVNMKRDAVQHERAPRSAQSLHYPLSFGARIRNLHSSAFFSNMPLHLQQPSMLDGSLPQTAALSSHYLPHSFLYPGMLATFPKPNILSGGIGNIFSSAYLPKTPHCSVPDAVGPRTLLKEDEVTSSEESSKDKSLEDISMENRRSPLDLPTLSDHFRPTIRPADFSSITLFPAENIYESATKLLFLSIKWARAIPSFLQLSYRDQSILLEESWSELFVLTAAQWSLAIDENVLITNVVAPTSRHTILEEEARKLRDVITRLSLLRLDHTEHACLKALVLFKAECRGLCEPSHVELLQDQTHVMLHEYCHQKDTTRKGRFGKLLLTLPSVQGISRRSLQELLFRQSVGDVAIDRLLMELTKNSH